MLHCTCPCYNLRTRIWKLNADATSLVFSTKLDGGTVNAIAVDAMRNLYVSGAANTQTFPTTPGAFQSQVLPTARAEPRYPDQIVKAVGDGIQAALFTDKSGQQAAAVAADAIDSFLKTYKGAH